MYRILIHTIMIRSFKDSLTEDVFNGVVRRGFPADLIKVARRKLRFLHAAHMLADLRVPPGNRLESLKGDRAGRYSIRVNDQFRICFVWTSEGPEEVELIDYH
jgi:proteic killer suppression protein